MKHTAPALAVVVMTCSACCTTQIADPVDPDTVLLRENEPRVYAPILLSRTDVLSVGTLAQVTDHNDVFWCRNEGERPEGFDSSSCP